MASVSRSHLQFAVIGFLEEEEEEEINTSKSNAQTTHIHMQKQNKKSKRLGDSHSSAKLLKLC